ncbi:MAG TPA: hypothetical protein VFH51_12560, partial [Myxococcota bacterium]|nr:hypothetical protein [Myxococcota bacterium]
MALDRRGGGRLALMILWLGTLGLGPGTWHAVVLTLAAVVTDLALIVVKSALFRALSIGLFVVPSLLTG